MLKAQQRPLRRFALGISNEAMHLEGAEICGVDFERPCNSPQLDMLDRNVSLAPGTTNDRTVAPLVVSP